MFSSAFLSRLPSTVFISVFFQFRDLQEGNRAQLFDRALGAPISLSDSHMKDTAHFSLGEKIHNPVQHIADQVERQDISAHVHHSW